jgi:predicted nucleotidyltransferase
MVTTSPLVCSVVLLWCVGMLENTHLHQATLNELCERFCVRRLELFGSAANGRFDEATSDLDFLVEFAAECPLGPFRQYIDFQIALQKLFGRPIDLVERSAIRNPYFRQAVERGPRTLLYAA